MSTSWSMPDKLFTWHLLQKWYEHIQIHSWQHQQHIYLVYIPGVEWAQLVPCQTNYLPSIYSRSGMFTSRSIADNTTTHLMAYIPGVMLAHHNPYHLTSTTYFPCIYSRSSMSTARSMPDNTNNIFTLGILQEWYDHSQIHTRQHQQHICLGYTPRGAWALDS